PAEGEACNPCSAPGGPGGTPGTGESAFRSEFWSTSGAWLRRRSSRVRLILRGVTCVLLGQLSPPRRKMHPCECMEVWRLDIGEELIYLLVCEQAGLRHSLLQALERHSVDLARGLIACGGPLNRPAVDLHFQNPQGSQFIPKLHPKGWLEAGGAHRLQEFGVS